MEPGFERPPVQANPKFPRWLLILMLSCCAFMLLAGGLMVAQTISAQIRINKIIKDVGGDPN